MENGKEKAKEAGWAQKEKQRPEFNLHQNEQQWCVCVCVCTRCAYIPV